MFIKTLKTYHL